MKENQIGIFKDLPVVELEETVYVAFMCKSCGCGIVEKAYRHGEEDTYCKKCILEILPPDITLTHTIAAD
jgi:hypothetical protein